MNGDSAVLRPGDGAVEELRNRRSSITLYLSTLPRFDDQKLLERTLDFAISPDVRSQDALRVVTQCMENPAGEKLAWDFIQTHWDAVAKAGGPFASADVVGDTSVFCDAGMREQVTEFFAAHKIAAAERTYKQSIERINNCIDFKVAAGTTVGVVAGTAARHGGRKIIKEITTGTGTAGCSTAQNLSLRERFCSARDDNAVPDFFVSGHDRQHQIRRQIG